MEMHSEWWKRKRGGGGKNNRDIIEYELVMTREWIMIHELSISR